MGNRSVFTPSVFLLECSVSSPWCLVVQQQKLSDRSVMTGSLGDLPMLIMLILFLSPSCQVQITEPDN